MKLTGTQRLMAVVALNMQQAQLSRLCSLAPFSEFTKSSINTPIEFLAALKNNSDTITEFVEKLKEMLGDYDCFKDLHDMVRSLYQQCEDSDLGMSTISHPNGIGQHRPSQEQKRSFNRVLNKISDNIPTHKLRIMVTVTPIPESRKERISQPCNLFDEMKQCGCISENDLEYLEDLIDVLHLISPVECLEEYKRRFPPISYPEFEPQRPIRTPTQPSSSSYTSLPVPTFHQRPGHGGVRGGGSESLPEGRESSPGRRSGGPTIAQSPTPTSGSSGHSCFVPGEVRINSTTNGSSLPSIPYHDDLRPLSSNRFPPVGNGGDDGGRGRYETSAGSSTTSSVYQTALSGDDRENSPASGDLHSVSPGGGVMVTPPVYTLPSSKHRSIPHSSSVPLIRPRTRSAVVHQSVSPSAPPPSPPPPPPPPPPHQHINNEVEKPNNTQNSEGEGLGSERSTVENMESFVSPAMRSHLSSATSPFLVDQNGGPHRYIAAPVPTSSSVPRRQSGSPNNAHSNPINAHLNSSLSLSNHDNGDILLPPSMRAGASSLRRPSQTNNPRNHSPPHSRPPPLHSQPPPPPGHSHPPLPPPPGHSHPPLPPPPGHSHPPLPAHCPSLSSQGAHSLASNDLSLPSFQANVEDRLSLPRERVNSGHVQVSANQRGNVPCQERVNSGHVQVSNQYGNVPRQHQNTTSPAYSSPPGILHSHVPVLDRRQAAHLAHTSEEFASINHPVSTEPAVSPCSDPLTTPPRRLHPGTIGGSPVLPHPPVFAMGRGGAVLMKEEAIRRAGGDRNYQSLNYDITPTSANHPATPTSANHPATPSSRQGKLAENIFNNSSSSESQHEAAHPHQESLSGHLGSYKKLYPSLSSLESSDSSDAELQERGRRKKRKIPRRSVREGSDEEAKKKRRKVEPRSSRFSAFQYLSSWSSWFGRGGATKEEGEVDTSEVQSHDADESDGEYQSAED